MLVERDESTYESARVLDGNADSIVNPLQKLAASRHILLFKLINL